MDAYDLMACTAQNQDERASYVSGVARSLQALGRPALLQAFLRGSSSSDGSSGSGGDSMLPAELAEYQREACWRSSLWKLHEGRPETLACFVGDVPVDSFHGNLLCLLNTFRLQDRDVFFATLDNARCLIVKDLTRSSIERWVLCSENYTFHSFECGWAVVPKYGVTRF